MEVHVRSTRVEGGGAPFWVKRTFQPRAGLYACLVVLKERTAPIVLLIPSLEWLRPDDVLRDLPNHGGKTEPEWRLNTAAKHQDRLREYSLNRVVRDL